jgi:predicted GTPase
VPTRDAEKLLDVQFYFDTAQSLAEQLARFYHPSSKDPFGPLRIPEMLAVVQLASEDLTELVDVYLPGGHLLTVDHWRKASQVSDWYGHASKAYWIVSALYSPVNTAARYMASKAGMSRPLELLGENLKVWFFTAFVHRVGHYLIELNSGRLRVGAKRYRELLKEHGLSPVKEEQGAATPASPPRQQGFSAKEVTITLLGRVKAGKSSLINALLGERRAATDVLPMTSEITKYELRVASSITVGGGAASSSPPYEGGAGGGRSAASEPTTRLVLLDTVGYAHEGPRADQLAATVEAVQQSDIVLLVMHARDPARRPDVELLNKLRAWFQERPHLKPPPILGVLTHIDLLSPALEWSPPYDYVQPQRGKEQNIAAAVEAAREQFGGALADVIPACTAENKSFGVQEWLLPQIVARLDEARAVALLRCLRAESDEGKIRRVLTQLLTAGKQLYRVATEPPAVTRPGPR